MKATLLAGALFLLAGASAQAGNTPVTMQIDRTLDPSPVCVSRVTSGSCTPIGTISSANIWTPTGPNSAVFAPSAFTDTTNASNITSGTLATARIPKGASVNDPGTGKLETLLPPQAVTGASKTFAQADLFQETRRSNSGSAMSDTFPPSTTVGLVNGTRIVVVNADPTGIDTITAGSGTLINNAATDAIGPGRAIQYVWDAAAGTWRRSLNTGTALLGPNNLSDVANVASARTNLGLGTIATQSASAVAITGGSETGVSYNNATIGALTPGTGTFSTLTAVNPPIFTALTGYVKANGASAASAALTVPTTDLSGVLQAAQSPAYTGDVASSAGSLTTTIQPGVVTAAKMGTGAAATNVGTLGGDLTGTLPNPTIGANAVGYSKMAQSPTSTFSGNPTGATANRQDMTATQATGLLNSFVGDSGSGGTKGVVPAPSAGDAAAGKFLSAAGGFAVPAAVSASRSSVRQTVSGGPASAGAPSWLAATSASLTPAAQNVSSTSPLTITAASGQNATGPLDYVSQFTTNPTLAACPASGTDYLLENAQTGGFSCTALQPIYQYGGTISTASGQFTFDYQAMVGYLGNGTTAVATPLVALGECTAGTSSLSGCVAYAYNGYYESPFTNTLPSALSTVAHNLGVVPRNTHYIVQDLTAEGGYAVGDQITDPMAYYGSANYAAQHPAGLTRNAATVNGAPSTYVPSKATNATYFTLTAANWKWMTTYGRGWGGSP